jgi:hypothetical protein
MAVSKLKLSMLKASVALEIGDHLRLHGALGLRQIEGLRNVVGIDIGTEIDASVQ